MKQRTDLDRFASVDLPADLQHSHGANREWSGMRGHVPPVAMAILGVFSFLTCGAAVVATATLVALQIQ